VRPALLVFGYAVAVAWGTPALLARLTSAGISARLGLAAWLTAMASALASLAVAMQYLVTAAIAGWSQLAEAVCRSVAGGACTAMVYRGAAFELGLGLAAIAATLALAVLAWRYGRGVQRAQRRTRAHAEAARITGRRLPVKGAGEGGAAVVAGTVVANTVVIDATRPAAYCVPGRPAAIVLTSGALAVLDPGQLTAVLAHERAHLAGRHHLLTALTRGLAATFPAVPLFTRGPAEVARLAEMCADDAAARRSGRPTAAGDGHRRGRPSRRARGDHLRGHRPGAAAGRARAAGQARAQPPGPGHRDTTAGPGVGADHPLRGRAHRARPDPGLTGSG
jgi:Zn-dependent protease with chaperone function